jgi:hypothetical protein
METLVIEEGGVCELMGENPRIRVKNILNDGVIAYSGNHNQTLLRADGGDSPLTLEVYNTLILGGSGIKVLDGIQVQVVDSLIIEEQASFSALNGGGLTFADADSWLVYRGSVAQTAGALEWVAPPFSKNILLDNPFGLTIEEPMEIGGVFRFHQGRVSYINQGILSLSQEGSFQGMDADKFVNGPVEVSGNVSKFLPIGKAGLYRPVISEIQGSGSHKYTLEVIDGPVEGSLAEPIVDFLGDFHWQLYSTTGHLDEGIITFFFEPSQFPFSNDDLVVAFAGKNTTTYEARPIESVTDGQITVTVNPEGLYSLATLTPFSEQHFHHFETKPSLRWHEVDLVWSFRQDDLSESLLIFRSRDAYNWQLIKTVSLEPVWVEYLTMRWQDYPPSTGIWYYQLEHRRVEGESIFTEVVRAEVKNPQQLGAPSVSVDVGSDLIRVDFTREAFHGNYRIFNAKGKLVSVGEIHKTNGMQGSIPLHSLPSGLYFLSLEWNGSQTPIKRFVKP